MYQYLKLLWYACTEFKKCASEQQSTKAYSLPVSNKGAGLTHCPWATREQGLLTAGEQQRSRAFSLPVTANPPFHSSLLGCPSRLLGSVVRMNLDANHLCGFLRLLFHAQCCAGSKLDELTVVLTAVQCRWILYKHSKLDALRVVLTAVQCGWILYK